MRRAARDLAWALIVRALVESKYQVQRAALRRVARAV